MPMTDVYGLVAEFETSDELIEAARQTHDAGYRHVEAFSPYPLKEAAAAIGHRRTGIPFVVFLGGLVGACGGFFMMYWISVINYPINVGGRPLNSWPSFIPITFELTVLTAAFSSFFALLRLCGLPRFHHPLFASPMFARASIDRFYLCIEASDPKYDVDAIRFFLTDQGAIAVEEVRG